MKKKQIALIGLFFLTLIQCTNKSSEINSPNVFKDSLADYFSLANDLSSQNEKRLFYNDKAFTIVVEQENDSLCRKNLFKVANRYYNINNWKDFGKTVRIVSQYALEANDTVSLAKSYSYLGDYFVSQTVSDSAFLYYYKAEKMYEKLKDDVSLCKILINKANLQYKAGDFLGSEKSAFSVLRIIKGVNQQNNILYDAYNLLGLVYNELGEYDNAITYNNKALSVIDDNVMPIEFQSRATSYNNIGFLYQNSQNYLLAKRYFQKGLEQDNLLLHKPFVYAMLLDNLAYVKFKLKESVDLPQLFYESLKLKEDLKLTSEIFITKIHLSEYFLYKKDTLKALKYSTEALELSREFNNPHNVLVGLKQMANVDPEKA